MLQKLFLFLICVGIIFANSGCRRRGPQNLNSVLHVALRQKVNSLDPARTSDYYASVLVSRAYEGLLQYKYLKRPYELEGALAEGLPEIQNDGRTYIFHIKKGVRFQNDPCFKESLGVGREVIAQDFVYSWRRILDPALGSPGRSLLESRVAEVSAPEKYKFVVKLKTVLPQFSYLAAMNFTAAVPREAVETYGADFDQHPVGTGPFVLKKRTANQYIWEKNSNFREEHYPVLASGEDKNSGLLVDAGQRLPFLDGIIDDVIVEDQPVWLNFQKGAHDYLMKVPADAPVNQVTDGLIFVKSPAADVTYFAFNMDHPILGKNKLLRQAMSLAYDVGPVIEKFYDGLAQKAEFLMPPPLSDYDSSYENPYSKFNMVKARELLTKAGFDQGKGLPEFALDAPNTSVGRLLAEYFQRSMTQLGVRVRINAVPWPELMSRVQRRQGEIYALAWVYDYPDADNGVQVFYGPYESPGPNKANYKNKAYDKLYEMSRGLPPGPKRKSLLNKMRSIVEEDAPWIYGVHRTETRLLHPWVKNFKINLFDNSTEKYLRLDAQQRQSFLNQIR